MLRNRKTIAVPAAALIVALVIVARYAFAMDGDDGGAQARLAPASWRDDSLTLANLGHATVLMNYFGVRAISDPALFSKVGLSIDSIFTIGPSRYSPAPLTPGEIGNLDLILITHAHMDHLDVPSLKALPKTATVVACSQCSTLLTPLGFADVRELKWGEETEVKGLRIRAMGARHWGRRWPPYGRDYGFNSYVLEKNGHRMLLACDSADTELFAELAANPPEVAAFSIGAYNPWIWNHANPEQVWQMFESTRAKYLVPIHWGTFQLGREPMDEPLERLERAAGDQSSRIVMRQIGVAWSLPAAADEARSSARAAAGR